MSRWNNDYNHGAHPAVLEAFIKTNQESMAGMGWTNGAKGRQRRSRLIWEALTLTFILWWEERR